MINLAIEKFRVQKSDFVTILNADDPLVTKLALKHKGKITYYGMDKKRL